MVTDLRRSPATATLATLWVLVFAMMHARQEGFSWGMNPFAIGGLGTDITHQFGDATSAELMAGQTWRALTSTFVHYSLLHLALNLFGLLELGFLIEAWYGSAMFLAICVSIGGLGNLLAGLARPWFGIAPTVHSGGGSTIIFGLIGLCVVVGWRSSDQDERELGRQMLAFLGLNALLGLLIPLADRLFGVRMPSLDNLAHAGGTIVGAGLGLFHRWMVASGGRPIGRRIGLGAALVIVGCMAEQSLFNRAEVAANERRAAALERRQAAQIAAAHLVQLDVLYRMAYLKGRQAEAEARPSLAAGLVVGVRDDPDQALPPEDQIRAGIRGALGALASDAPVLADARGERAFRRFRELAARATVEPPTALRVQEFESYLAELLGRADRASRKALAEMEPPRPAGASGTHHRRPAAPSAATGLRTRPAPRRAIRRPGRGRAGPTGTSGRRRSRRWSGSAPGTR